MAWTTPKTDFDPGDVLTADEMNAIGENLDVLFDRDGLVSVATAAVSAATTINFNSCFSSTYKNYRIIADGGVTSVGIGGDVTFRMRSGTTDNSDAQYYYYGAKFGGSLSAFSANTATSWVVGFGGFNTSNSLWGSLIIDLYNPFGSGWTNFTSDGIGVDSGGSEVGVRSHGSHRVAASFNGFSLFYPQAITTTVRVYGYNNVA